MKQKINILFVMNWPDTTGLMLKRAHETYEHLATSLKKQGIECYIAYPKVSVQNSDETLNKIELDCTKFSDNKDKIKSFVVEKQIGTIVYIDPPMFWSANLYFKAWGIKHVAYVRYSHGFIHMSANTPRSMIKRFAHELGVLSADNYIAISKSGNEKLTSAMGIPKRKISYIPNGIDVRYFPEESRRVRASSVHRIVSVFQMRPQKNIMFILDVIKELSVRRSDFEYLHLGGGEQLEEAKRYAKQLGIETQCQFVGHVDNSIDYLKSADVFLHACEDESFCNSITEAMGCGTPLVVVKSDGALEQVVSTVGTVIDGLDVQKFCNAIEKYLDEDSLKQQAYDNGPARAKSEFSMENQSRGLEALLTEL